MASMSGRFKLSSKAFERFFSNFLAYSHDMISASWYAGSALDHIYELAHSVLGFTKPLTTRLHRKNQLLKQSNNLKG
jgi:hypothetical protein